jgi:hypothetical protein
LDSLPIGDNKKPVTKRVMRDTVQDKEWLIFKTRLGKHCKVHRLNLEYIPKDWQEITGSYFNNDGTMNEMGEGIIEIISKEQAKWYGSPASHDFGFIIGMIADG